jgi:pyruvate, orthophosphate dikinase
VTGDSGVVPLTEAAGLDRSVIGAKAASLVQLAELGLRTPPAFVVTTDVWQALRRDGCLSDAVVAAIDDAVAALEARTGRHFGGDVDPLLLSVRSGSAASMPGMLDTILDVGFGPGTRRGLAAMVDEAFARRCHHRFLAGWASVVLGQEVPAAPRAQLLGAVTAVLRSWENERAHAYRARHGIDHELGTAVVVQAMVFGDRSTASGTGVAFSRDPDTGRPGLCGDFLPGAQGTDVVDGTHDPLPVAALAAVSPEAFADLETAVNALEEATGDMVDVEFTVEDATLHLLQHRPGPRAAAAAVRIAVDLVDAGVITVDEAIRRVTAEQLALAARPTVAGGAPGLLGTGVGACPGVAGGEVCLSPDHVTTHGGPVVLVRDQTSPDDVHGMTASAGLLTAHGGLVSHAALVARELDLPAVVGVEGLEIDESAGTATLGGTVLRDGDAITVDGASGRVHAGIAPVVASAPGPHLGRFRAWLADREGPAGEGVEPA